MGATASVITPSEAVNSEQEVAPTTTKDDSTVVDSFPKLGVKLSCYQAFMDRCGGRDVLVGKSTTDVCEAYVKPMTEQDKASYCEMLLKQGDPAVGIATVFISHAWKYHFLDVCDALLYHFRDNLDVYIWFDLFSNNQHNATSYDFHWWSNTFMSAIEQFGHTVMVFAPWNDPIPLTRAWCLWELFCTINTNSKFEVAMSRAEQQKFFADIQVDHNCVREMLAKIDVERSECYMPSDRSRIFAVVKESVGFGKLNSIVFDRMRKWIVDVIEAEVRHNKDLSDRERLELKRTLADQYLNFGNYDRAEELNVELLAESQKLFGEEDNYTFVLSSQLAGVYYWQGRFDEAKPLYAKYLKYCEQNPDDHQFNYSEALSNVAFIHYGQGEYDDAIPLFEKALQIRNSLLGNTHPETAQLMNDLGALYYCIKQYDEAEDLLVKCWDIRKEIFGAGHCKP